MMKQMTQRALTTALVMAPVLFVLVEAAGRRVP
jgi:hypothetical protein